MKKSDEWIPIKEKLPPLGMCIIVTIKNHIECGKSELRYPVYYMEKPCDGGYAFYCEDTGNILLPEYSEVTAWMQMPLPYCEDDE